MLTLKAEADAGTHLRDCMLGEALELAQRTWSRIEVDGNETKFWIMPTDSLEALKEAFDRLYPTSRLVGTMIHHPWPRDSAKPADSSGQ